MKTASWLFAGLIALLLLAGCQNGSVSAPQQPAAPAAEIPAAPEPSTLPDESAGIANPAAENCITKGGTLEIRESKAGEYGVCLFEDNRQCEEWALFRGQCPASGVKVTGYENDAQVYCAITGGTVEGVGTPVPMCKRIDGTYCNAQANLDGECPDPNDPNPNAGNVEAQ